jgi:putative DNA primase/helicase
MKIDIVALRSSFDIVDVIGRYMKLEKDGAEYSSACPFHDEKSASFKVSPKKQFFQCFGCGEHGDVVDFVQRYRDINFRDAVNEITNGNPPTSINPPKPRAIDEKEDEKEWVPIMPVPSDVPPPGNVLSLRKRGKWTPLDFVERFDYLDQDGNLLGHTVRFEWDQDGERHKDYIPQTWCRNNQTGELKWKWLSFPKPRPMYGLQQLKEKPEAIVWVMEGERKADAVNRMAPSVVALAWPGGAKALKYIAFEPLRGRRVLLWPDADDPGVRAMDGFTDPESMKHDKGLAEYINGIASAVKIVDPPDGVAKSWDLKDAEREGWDANRLVEHIKSHARPPMYLKKESEKAPETREENPPPSDYGSGEREAYDDQFDEGPEYRPLGYDKGRFYYLAGRAAQVIDLASSSHTKLNLMSIAPLHHWLRTYPSGKDSNEAQWDFAANALMRQCEDVGVFNPDKIRGRGAWWDGGKSILHVGDCLIIDGQQASLTTSSVKYIYEAAPPLHLEIDNPLSAREANEFVKLCSMLQWEKPISGMLLAGWIFLAPICGALQWRPHIWITGGAGTGKSWVQSNIVSPSVGNTAIMPQGVATEAGIRQLLGMDARPVIFDEAEGENAQAQARIQSIMELARQASSESRGSIVKGSATGKAITYRIRSMFAFSSIGVGVQQYADKTRVTVLGMSADPAKSKEQRARDFDAIQAVAGGLLTEEFASRLRARAVNMIGIVRANAKTFASAGAAIIGTQRLGDQIGTMLAGAYALHANGLITPEDALQWIEKQDWADQTAIQEVKDEQSCLSYILEQIMRVSGRFATVERSVGELVELATSPLKRDESIPEDVATDQLLRIGIRIDGDGIVIANTHTSIGKMLSGTVWSREWGRILKRVDGAQARGSARFGGGGSHRGVWIPLSAVTGK